MTLEPEVKQSTIYEDGPAEDRRDQYRTALARLAATGIPVSDSAPDTWVRYRQSLRCAPMVLTRGMRVRCVLSEDWEKAFVTRGDTYTIDRHIGAFVYLLEGPRDVLFRSDRFKPLIRVKMGRLPVPEPVAEPPK